MISIAKLAQELGVTEQAVLDRAMAMRLKLRGRGKSLQESEAGRLKKAFAASAAADTPEEITESEGETQELAIPLFISVKELSERLDRSPSDILKVLLQNGVLANLNADVDFDTAAIIADEFGFQAVEEKTGIEDDLDEIVTENRLQEILGEDDPKKLKSRPPVITIMGHVDHGKTSLLDAIRETNVTAGEAGGITQHIGAYQVVKNDRRITFLDTPGHEAFTAMRARGAQVTDIAILVVAADDGVRPQTVEAIQHARAAEVPIIVAVNKIDKPGADLERVKRELAEHDLAPEDWGGQTIFAPISAKEKTGIDSLLEMILLVADMKDLKANPDRPAVGTIVEAKKTAHRGVTATVLIQSGTLKLGEPILVGSVAGRVKAMVSDNGSKLKEAPPATPAEILGLTEVPEAGDILQVVEDERTAYQLSEMLKRKARAERLRPLSKISLESFYDKMQGAEIKTLNIVLRADVQGSVEAITDALKKLQTDEVKIKILLSGTGDLLPTDITLAAASQAVVIGFGVKKTPSAIAAIQKTGVDARIYGIIYKLLEDIQKAMGGLLTPEDIVMIKGQLLIKGVFSDNRDRWTVGGVLQEGRLTRGERVRIRRGEEILGESHIVSLRKEHEDVKEVKAGIECGVLLKKVSQEIKEGDYLESYVIEKRKREL